VRVRILGSAAGGGVPQWNCTCVNCRAARCGTDVHPRTQDTVAVSADGRTWFLLNASPDILRQIEAARALQPERARAATCRGGSPIAGVVLTNGDLDHCLGLLLLREWTRLGLFATRRTHAGLFEENVVLRTLAREPAQLAFHPLALGDEQPLVAVDGRDSGLMVRAFAVPGKLPLHLEGLIEPHAEHNVGLVVRDTVGGGTLVYAPAAAATEPVAERSADADILLFDGTFWSDGELEHVGLFGHTARTMAHIPVGGAGGSLAQLAGLRVPRRILTHINNTNPIVARRTRERIEVESRGWLVARDGWELST
jgi:pyrroloquinoline quinone biosynthesis protein B